MGVDNCNSGDCACSGKNQLEALQSPTSSHLSDDDVWASSDDEIHDNIDSAEPDYNKKRISVSAQEDSKDVSALKRRHENRGYFEGLTKGKDSGLQKGFDEGYPTGAALGGLVGELIADTLWKLQNNQIDESKKDQILNDLKIENILSSDYFDDNLDMKDPQKHPIIQKWTLFLQSI